MVGVDQGGRRTRGAKVEANTMSQSSPLLHFQVLGPFQAQGLRLPTRKAEALAAYLALEAGRPHRRDSLMALLWGDRADKQARHSLSQTLFSLRKAFGDAAGCLVTDGDAVMVVPSLVRVDAREFQRLSASSDLADLAAAADLCRGDLLQGLNVQEVAYQDWLAGERIRFKEMALALYGRLCARHEEAQDLDLAVQAAVRLVALDPLQESAHRTLMRLYAAQGRATSALRQYDHLAALLKRELDEEPEPETRQLQAEIARRRRRTPPAAAPPSPPPESPAETPAAAPATLAPLHPVTAAPTLFGRDGELYSLNQWLADSLEGRRRLVFVSGEAGIGKTTLVDAFMAGVAARHPNVLIGHSQCIDLRGPAEPFMPVLEMLTGLCRAAPQARVAMETTAPSWLKLMPALGAGPATPPDGVGTRERLLRELLDAVEAIAATQPLLLILEDLHWSDCSTLDFIDGMISRRAAAPVMLLGTCRCQDPTEALRQILDLRIRGLAQVLPLEPLGAAAVKACLSDRFSDAAACDALASVLIRRCGGNPLFMRNLLDWWTQTGAVGSRDGSLSAAVETLESGVPETLEFLINRMVERLDERELAILEAASVAGATFTAAVVATALDMDIEDVEAKAGGLARRGALLRPAGEAAWPDGTVTAAYAFQHQLYRDGVYGRLLPSARQRMHRAIGTRLELAHAAAATPPAAEIAMHFVQGYDAPKAVRWLEQAAVHALERGAHRDALALLDRALGLLPNLEPTERVHVELQLLALRAPALVSTRGWLDPDAEACYLRICDLSAAARDPHRQSAALFGLAALKEFRGEYLETQAILVRQEAEFGEITDPSLKLACSELLACSTFHCAQFERSVEAAEQTLAGYDPGRDINIVAAHGENPMVSSLCWAGRSLWFLGRTAEAVARLEQALRAAEMQGHSFALALANEHMARLRQHMGEPSATLAHAARAVALGEEFGFPYRIASGSVLRGWARAMLGDPLEGLEEIDQGLARCRAVGAVIEYPYFLSLQTEALQAAGRPAAGLAVLEEARRQAQSRAGFFYTAEILRLTGHLYLPGDEGRAEEAFQAALSTARQQGALEPENRAALDLARLWLRQGRGKEVEHLIGGMSPRLSQRPAGVTVNDLRTAQARALAASPTTVAPTPAMQQVRFCTARDGARIAYSETGHGRPLVKAGNWLTHLEFDWQSPIWQPLFSELSESCRLVRYDPRGTGLSDWHPPEITFYRWVDDLEAVADAAGLDRFALLGLSQGAAVSIAYAARHPERVSHLIILNGYARGRRRRGKAGADEYENALNTLIREGSGMEAVAHRQMFSALFLPEGNPAQISWFAELERVSTSPENAVKVRQTSGACDVTALLPHITTPTLVLHGRRDAVVPLEEGRLIAAGIPGARFVSLDSCNHLMLPEEPEWQRLINEIRHFLRSDPKAASEPALSDWPGAELPLSASRDPGRPGSPLPPSSPGSGRGAGV